MKIKFYLLIILTIAMFVSASERPRFGGKLIYLRADNLGDRQYFLKYNPELIYEPLCYIKAGECYSMIFEKMIIESSSIHLVIRDNLRWHDNSPVTTEEVRDTIRTALDNSPFKHLILNCVISKSTLFNGKDTIVIDIAEEQIGNDIFGYLSTIYLRDKFRFSGPFYPEKKQGKNLVLLYNLNCPSGRAMADKLIFLDIPLNLVMHNWIDCNFCILELNATDKIIESFKNKYQYMQRSAIYYLLCGNGFSFDERMELNNLIYKHDFVKGLFEGKARKIEKPENEDSTGDETISGQLLKNIKQITLYYTNTAFDRKIAERINAILLSKGITVLLSVSNEDYINIHNAPDKRFLILNSTYKDKNNESGFNYSMIASAFRSGVQIDIPDELHPVTIEDIQNSESLLFLFEINRVLFYSPGMKGQKSIADNWMPITAGQEKK
ncbi:MAG: hypothetical protein JW737_01875 [Acidobacteria bacterium]|nr:hypothetical protein [Acidobacteriota bacterium]